MTGERSKPAVRQAHRRRYRPRRGPWPLLIGVCLLSACSSASSPPETAKLPPSVNGYKVGKPYAIKGVWYVPRVDYAYDEVGIASWYGPGFDGQMTANGEIYDMNELTAAHKTLPMPSIVRVTNLDNGRTLTLKINDRGPFVDGRIIDVSRRAAQLLGFFGNGTAPVRVEIVADESRRLAQLLTGSDQDPKGDAKPAAAPQATLAAATLPVVEAVPAVAPVPVAETAAPPPGAPSAPAAPAAQAAAAVAPESARAYVQAGAFARSDNAWRAQTRLARLGAAEIDQANVDGRNLFRVRLGPFPSDAEAHRVLAAVIREGFSGSQVVFE